MRFRDHVFMALLMLPCLACYSFANDSASFETTTGIEFTLNNDISIESELLFLGAESVSVEYVFYNHSDNEIDVNMAFPLSEKDVLTDSANSWPQTKDFRVYVDGQMNNDVKIRWRALVRGIDKALFLKRMGISVERPAVKYKPYLHNGHAASIRCLDHKLSRKNQEVLIREHLASRFPGDVDCLEPYWVAQATYLWKMKFRPKTETTVKHTYTQWPGWWSSDHTKENSEHLEKTEFGNALRKLGYGDIVHSYYAYVIHTGGNWKGPIKKFRLVAQGPKDSWTWVEAPFPVKRESDSKITAELENYKPVSKPECDSMIRTEITQGMGLKGPCGINFHYAKRSSFPK